MNNMYVSLKKVVPDMINLIRSIAGNTNDLNQPWCKPITLKVFDEGCSCRVIVAFEIMW